MFGSIRKAFLSGIVLLAPLGITFFVFNWLVDKIGGSFKAKVFFFIPRDIVTDPELAFFWNVCSTVIVLFLVTLLGYVSRWVIARYLWSIGERFLRNLPLVNTVYNSVKQIVDTFSSQNRAVFERVVLIQFPRPNCYAIGFLTSRAKGEIQGRTDREVFNIFVPTTPNPTSGFLVMVPSEDIHELDMTVGEGMKLIISGGTVVPPWEAVNALDKDREIGV